MDDQYDLFAWVGAGGASNGVAAAAAAAAAAPTLTLEQLRAEDAQAEADAAADVANGKAVINMHEFVPTSSSYDGGDYDDVDELEDFRTEVEIARGIFGDDQVSLETDGETGLCARIQVLSRADIEQAMKLRRVRTDGLTVVLTKRRGQWRVAVALEPWHNIFTGAESLRILAEGCEAGANAPHRGPGAVLAVTGAIAVMASTCIVNSTEYPTSAVVASQLVASGIRARLPSQPMHPRIFVGSIDSIVAHLPSYVDVQHAENVMRVDLARRFEAQQHEYFVRYVRDLERGERSLAHLNSRAEVSLAFHGTAMHNVGSIVEHGLIVPGTNGVSVRCGSRFGNGIYTSPSAEFALNYAQQGGRTDDFTIKLMVCAVLLGRSRKVDDEDNLWGEGVVEGYDSHVSADGEQYVAFNAAQVLPCYVLHLAARSHDTRPQLQLQPSLRAQARATTNGAERQRLMRLAAMKNLPFGFGPAGAHFVVEDAASASDDDEDYGVFVSQLRSGIAIEEYQNRV